MARRHVRAAVAAKKAAAGSRRRVKSATHKAKHEKDFHVGHKTTGAEHKVNAPKHW